MPNYYNETNLRQLDSLKVESYGIIDRIGSVAMSDTARVVVIGVGGMGLKTITALKKELQARVGRIDRNYIRFLSIDTSSTEISTATQSGALTKEEAPYLDNSSLGAVFKLPRAQQPSYLSGIMSENALPVTFRGDGANQIRMAGRLSLLESTTYNGVVTAIRSAISGLKDFVTKTLEVYVVGGVGGGTGSGMIVDIPYIVRKVANTLGVNERLRLMGYIYLPDVYDPCANGTPNTGNLEAAYRNGYAALKEIDYYMNIAETGETYDAEYADGSFSSSENIFRTCTLIGGHSSVGYIFPDPKAEAINVCVQNLINQVTRVVGEKDASGNAKTISGFFTSQAFQDNSTSALLGILSAGNVNLPQTANYRYIVSGAASLEIPHEAVVNSFFGKVFDAVRENLKGNVSTLTNSDVDAFEAETMSPAYIVDKAAKDFVRTVNAKLNDPDHRWNKAAIAGNTLDGLLDTLVDSALTQFQNNYRVDDLISALNVKAEAIFKDINKGPYYLERLLNSNSANGQGVNGFFNRLAKYAEEVKTIGSTSGVVLARAEAERAQICSQVAGALLGPNGARVEAYKEQTKTFFESKFKQKLAEWLSKNVYLGIGTKSQKCVELLAQQAIESRFMGAADILEYICSIVEKNAEKAQEDLNPLNANSHSIFSLTDLTLNPLRDTLLQTAGVEFNSLGRDGVDEFVEAILFALLHDLDEAGNPKWVIVAHGQASFGESRCADAFREFVSNYPAFSSIIKRTMKDYLDDAYHAEAHHVKEGAISAILGHINAHSAPMCAKWDTFNFADLKNLCYQYMTLPEALGDPNDGESWAAEFSNAFGAAGLQKTVYKSCDPNMLYSFTMYDRMPIWMDKKMAIYEKNYNDLAIPGIHINEHADFQFSYKDYPSLFHKDAWFHAKSGGIEYTNQREVEIADEISVLINNADTHGLIVHSGDGYVAMIPQFIVDGNLPDPKAIAKFVSKYTNDEENRDDKGVLKVKKALFAKFCEAYPVVQMPIRAWNNYSGPVGNPEAQKEVAKELIRKQMKLWFLLKKAWDFYNENLYSELSSSQKADLFLRQGKEIANYYLFNQIHSSRGRVVYTLADQDNEILFLPSLASNPNTAWKSEYPELAVTEAFFGMDNIDRVKPKMQDQLERLKRGIDDEASFTKLEDTYKELAERCADLLSALERIEDRGGDLNKNQKLARLFYKAFKEALDENARVYQIKLI